MSFYTASGSPRVKMIYCKICEKWCRDDCPCFESHSFRTVADDLETIRDGEKK